jgi:hypothetical protein
MRFGIVHGPDAAAGSVVGCTGAGIGTGAGAALGVSRTVTVDGAAVTVVGALLGDPQALNARATETKAPK